MLGTDALVFCVVFSFFLVCLSEQYIQVLSLLDLVQEGAFRPIVTILIIGPLRIIHPNH